MCGFWKISSSLAPTLHSNCGLVCADTLDCAAAHLDRKRSGFLHTEVNSTMLRWLEIYIPKHFWVLGKRNGIGPSDLP
jgi:hypothetical protein